MFVVSLKQDIAILGNLFLTITLSMLTLSCDA